MQILKYYKKIADGKIMIKYFMENLKLAQHHLSLKTSNINQYNYQIQIKRNQIKYILKNK